MAEVVLNNQILYIIQCKHSFVAKLHLVPGKSPVKKVRVKDVDQRGGYLDDVDFIWAALETESEEYNSSDYEPPSCDVSCLQ
jgi:hypothetical protein